MPTKNLLTLRNLISKIDCMNTPDSVNTHVTYLGHNVRDVLNDNVTVVKAVWGYCGLLAEARVKIHVAPRLEGEIEWTIDIVTPYGRRTMVANQRSITGSVSFTPG